MEVLVKICRVLDCDFGDIMEIVPTQKSRHYYMRFERIILSL